jgi:hypothetical protein
MTPQLTVIPGGKKSTQPQVLTTGVHIANNRYVPVGAVITNQTAANRLPFTRKQLHLTASTISRSKSVSYLQAA